MITGTKWQNGSIEAATFTWTREDVVAAMKEIAKRESMSIRFLTKTEGMGGYNYGGSAGNSIMLAPFVKVPDNGKYDGYDFPHGCSNPLECQFATFFHELAHCILTPHVPSLVDGYSWNDTSAFQFELWITMLGLEYAHRKYGIKFSDETVQWILDEAKTYCRPEDQFAKGLVQQDVNEDGYKVVSQWDFQGDKK